MLAMLLALSLADPAGQDGARSGPSTPARPPGESIAPPATMVVEPIAMAIVAWDMDGDGRTSRAEMTHGVAASFAAIEPKPGATLGYIGYSDWALRWLGDRNALPSPFEVDANGDDRITLDELQAAVAAAFDRLDRDHDGFVTRAEALTIRAGGGDERDRRGGDKHGGKRPPR